MKTYTFLLIEDNEGDVLLMSEALEESGIPFRLIGLQTGQEAIDKINQFDQSELPDLVILDINLPVKNGFEVMREIRNNPKTAALPVMILSTSSNQEDRRKAGQFQPKLFYTKPSDFGEFPALVEAIVSILPKELEK
ncbi:response regulator [Algoriphagus hitonicola]|uniref:Response regulator receiver domain-containing protein n=1 Tax=Algoriphagus hitonicola TaxID=435880 RepID=A0A1I2T6C0_9BACT|nr:response regulator [Algoriphagus hitonicola]SFG60462.1 Response regulator receiver domain-containing protein [Algoriphagus hitonicola]